jgi:protein-L-isoaspartate O-methyltransferase
MLEHLSRGFWWQDNLHVAHSDLPLREGSVHISAPHMYGSVLEALELQNNSPLSFLNAGSGTGYLSCIVATILGSPSSHFCKLKNRVYNLRVLYIDGI